MRIAGKDVTYEEWAQMVHDFELAEAKRRLARGDDIGLVLETMSARIQKKMLHPIMLAIRETTGTFDLEASKKAYEEAYLKKNSPKADHLTDD